MKHLIASILSALAVSGCTLEPCDNPDSDGSNSCEPPVKAINIEGTYCTDANPQEICLTVIQPYSNVPNAPARTRYLLSNGLCFEMGYLDGGIEFTPDTTSRLCMPGVTEYGLYSASGDWTATGLRLFVSQSDGSSDPEPTVLEMHYRG